MSPYKISGACTICDERCFEVKAVYQDHEIRPGEPKRLGKPLDGAMQLVFLLFDGSKTYLTFCGSCAQALKPDQYTAIWRKNMRSWKRELKGDRPEWFLRQFDNGLLCELGRSTWKELVACPQIR